VFQHESPVIQVLVQQTAEMKEQLRVVTGMLQEVLRRQRNLDGTQRGQLPDSVQLPLKDYSALETLEQRLVSMELHKQLVCDINCCVPCIHCSRTSYRRFLLHLSHAFVATIQIYICLSFQFD
jgi:hypothetical protein